MGVDAMIFFAVPKASALSKEQLRDLSYQMGRTVGSHNFFIYGGAFNGPDEPEDYDQYFIRELSWDPDPEDGYVAYGIAGKDSGTIAEHCRQDTHVVYQVGLFGRYYGPGYERGNWPDLSMLLKWLKIGIPNVEFIFYGGDSDENYELVSDRFISDMDAYYLSENGRNYYGNSDFKKRLFDINKSNTPDCPRCQHEMTDFGGGGGHGFWNCQGCGDKYVITKGDEKKDPSLWTYSSKYGEILKASEKHQEKTKATT